jgi:hypothetical protein
MAFLLSIRLLAEVDRAVMHDRSSGRHRGRRSPAPVSPGHGWTSRSSPGPPPSPSCSRSAWTSDPAHQSTIATHHVAGGDEGFFVEVQACYERWDPDTPPGLRLPAAAEVPAVRDELDRSGRFGPVEFRRYQWERSYSTAGYLEVLLT